MELSESVRRALGGVVRGVHRVVWGLRVGFGNDACLSAAKRPLVGTIRTYGGYYVGRDLRQELPPCGRTSMSRGTRALRASVGRWSCPRVFVERSVELSVGVRRDGLRRRGALDVFVMVRRPNIEAKGLEHYAHATWKNDRPTLPQKGACHLNNWCEVAAICRSGVRFSSSPAWHVGNRHGGMPANRRPQN